jgi:transcriptional regulator
MSNQETHVPGPVTRESRMPHDDLELLRGTLDLLVLRTLSWGPMHGLGVLRWIERATGDRLQVEEGALYPALHRMERRGWLEAEWGYTERNREAKFYRLTPVGRKQLAAELSRWSRYTEAVALLLAAEGAS